MRSFPPPRRVGNRLFLIAYAGLLLFLVIGSSARRVGDGGEYLAMAENLRYLRPPALSRADLSATERFFRHIDTGYDRARLREPRLRGRDGRQDMFHFWLYPALAAPWLAVTETLTVNPTYAFTVVNCG